MSQMKKMSWVNLMPTEPSLFIFKERTARQNRDTDRD
jgi:hypothetical protein